MANFIPSDKPIDFNHSIGEERVYETLHSLPDDYTVLYSLSWVGRDERYSVGEADFVILHPNHGILVIEVKSGEITCKDRQWFQTNTSNRTTIKIKPLKQAERNKHALIDFLEDSHVSPIPRVCYCAWFPSVTIPGGTQLPPNVTKEIIFDKTSLDNPERAILRCFSYWKSHSKYRFNGMSQEDFLDMREKLCPYFHFVPTHKTQMDEIERHYIRLTRKQSLLLDFLAEQRTAAIHGEAGTGKTVIAKAKAERITSQNESVLFLCFNDLLLEDLRKETIPNVTFHNVRSLVEELQGTVELSKGDDVRKQLEKILEKQDEGKWCYNNIIIDEGQDLSYQLLNQLLQRANRSNGCFYVFYDRNQFIQLPEETEKRQVSDWLNKEAECKLVLHQNCRNTAEVFKTSCSFLQLENAICNDVHGEIPSCNFYRVTNELEKIVDDFLKRITSKGFRPEDVVILTAGTINDPSLIIGKQYGGLELSRTMQKGKVFFTTIRKYKGLEAKVILIVGASISDLMVPEKQRLLYAGASRAKNMLGIAMYDDLDEDEMREFLHKIDPNFNVPRSKEGLKQLLNVSSPDNLE